MPNKFDKHAFKNNMVVKEKNSIYTLQRSKTIIHGHAAIAYTYIKMIKLILTKWIQALVLLLLVVVLVFIADETEGRASIHYVSYE